MTGRGCPCEFDGWELTRFSPVWHRAHKAHHLTVFPEVDPGTVRNLEDAIAYSERVTR